MDLKKIGGRIKKERNEKGFSQMQLAEKSNISSVHMSHIETGKVSMSLDSLIDICNALEVTPNYVLLDEYKKKAKESPLFFDEYLKDLTNDEIAFLIEVAKALSNSKINR